MSVGIALAAAGTLMGAKTALEGIREGNLFKAVAGGVGAYMGVSALGAASSAASQGASGIAGTTEGAASKMASNTVGSAIQDTATSNTPGLMGGSAMQNTGSAFVQGQGGINVGLNMNGANAVNSAAQGATPSAYSNLAGKMTADGALQGVTQKTVEAATPWDKLTDGLSGVSDWAKNNPLLAASGVQMAGGLLSGLSQEDLLREQWAREEEERRRRGAVPDRRSRFYNPVTRSLS